MRHFALAALVLTALAGGCAFRALPANGAQACSSDDPPQCPDGYACVAGMCYDNNHLPTVGDAGNDDAGAAADTGTCKPATIVCGSGSGKHCGKVPDQCGSTVECGTCIAGESCGTLHTCSVACGQAGQPCCTGDKCAASDTICSGGNCTACGGVAQPCCANETCTAPASCADNPTAGAAKLCLLTCPATTGSCTVGTDQDCTSACGPGNGPGKLGNRTCTCTASAWKCLTCSFPSATDYTCYKLPVPPATVPACDTTPPTIGTSCTAAPCAPCGSATGKGFLDLTNTAHAGYCVCTSSRWNCAVAKDWPCPGNTGC